MLGVFFYQGKVQNFPIMKDYWFFQTDTYINRAMYISQLFLFDKIRYVFFPYYIMVLFKYNKIKKTPKKLPKIKNSPKNMENMIK